MRSRVIPGLAPDLQATLDHQHIARELAGPQPPQNPLARLIEPTHYREQTDEDRKNGTAPNLPALFAPTRRTLRAQTHSEKRRMLNAASVHMTKARTGGLLTALKKIA